MSQQDVMLSLILWAVGAFVSLWTFLVLDDMCGRSSVNEAIGTYFLALLWPGTWFLICCAGVYITLTKGGEHISASDVPSESVSPITKEKSHG